MNRATSPESERQNTDQEEIAKIAGIAKIAEIERQEPITEARMLSRFVLREGRAMAQEFIALMTA